MADDTRAESDSGSGSSIQYLALDRRIVVNLLHNLLENGHFIQLKQLKVSAETNPIAADGKFEPSASYDDKEVISGLEAASISLQSLTALSLTSIKMQDMSGFLATVLNLNA